MVFSIIVWIEYLCLCSIIYGVGYHTGEPFDLNLSLFLLVVSCIFLIGHILEWKYHLSYPYAEIEKSYDTKKNMLYGVMIITFLAALTTVIYFTFEFKFSRILVVFLAILFLSLFTLFILTIKDKITKLIPSCKGNDQGEDEPQDDNHERQVNQLL